jgi:glycosyltransferase involved in cell wall biosynthesis
MAKFFFFETPVMELLVDNGEASGGAAVQTLVWMEGLYSQGHQIFLAKSLNDTRNIKPEYDFIQAIPIFHPQKGLKKIRWLSYRLPAIYKILKEIKPDYLYESVPFWGSWMINLICKKNKIIHIIRISNDRHLDHRFRMVASKFNQESIFYALKKCDIVLAQNDFQLNTLQKKIPDQRIFKIYNPIKIKFEYLKAKKEIQGYFAWIANFRYQKNIKLLFEIANELKDENFRIVGVPTIFDDESKFYVDELKKLPNVEFLGLLGRNEILPFLKDAKFLLNTSRFEGFSNTFLEAMLTGTPILSSNLVNPDGIITKYQLGIIYDDPSDLKLKINNLSQGEYQELSLSCITYLQEFHDYEKLSKIIYEKLYSIKSEKILN